jgi:4-alpha-glucanotransferase
MKLDEFITSFIFMFQVLSYVSLTGEDDISWALIQTALASVAQTAIIPMQDVLGLGSSARMNIPATQVKVHS